MKKNNDAVKILYDVIYEQIKGPDKKYEKGIMTLTKEELEKFIGRRTIQYGPPYDLSDGKIEGVTVFQFYKRTEETEIESTLTFFRARYNTNDQHKNTNNLPIVPMSKEAVEEKKEPPIKHPPHIEALLACGAIEKTLSYQNYYNRYS